MAINKSVLDKFDKEFATEDFNESVKDIEKNGKPANGDFPVIPVGKYEVSLRSLELTETKKTHEPMLSASFKILRGGYAKQLLWMNTVLTSRASNIHDANEFLRSLDTDVDVKWENSFSKYAQMVLDVFEQTSSLEYVIDYSKVGEKEYPHYEILDVFEVEK